jgi:hypothetical protein
MTLRRAIGVWSCGSLLVLSCKYSTPEPETGAPKEEPHHAERHEEPAPADAPSTTPEDAKRAPIEASGSCDDRACTATDDCCKGYQCGFDPERSKVQRYCLPQ